MTSEKGKTPRKFTWEEVAALNSRHNAHVSYRGKVYDVSKFVDQHPGGIEQILLGAGRDVSQLFDMYHDFKTNKVLEKFYVGDLVSNEFPTYKEPGAFAITLRKRVSDKFKELGIHPKDPKWPLARYACIIGSTIISLYLQLFFWGFSLSGVTMGAVLLCLSLTMGAFHYTHDASHFSISTKPWVWTFVGAWHDFVLGASMLVWKHQHIIGHHPYTNIDHADPDIVTASSNVPDIRRIKKTQNWLPRYVYQHIYVPMLYGLLSTKTRLQDLYLLFFVKKNGDIRFNDPSFFQIFIFLAGKAFYLTYRTILPYLAGMPLLHVIYQFFLVDALSGYILAIVFQVSHVSGNVDWPEPDENGQLPCWWELQVKTTQDYATDSWFWTYATGALNHQTAHHLFPSVAQTNLPVVTPIVKKTCEEFGLQYNDSGTFWKAVGSHIAHLKHLGYDEAPASQSRQTNKVLAKKEKGA